MFCICCVMSARPSRGAGSGIEGLWGSQRVLVLALDFSAGAGASVLYAESGNAFSEPKKLCIRCHSTPGLKKREGKEGEKKGEGEMSE